MPFENATIMRGSLQPLRVQYRHTTGVLLLWHKRDNTKTHLILYPEVDVTNLIENTTVLFSIGIQATQHLAMCIQVLNNKFNIHQV